MYKKLQECRKKLQYCRKKLWFVESSGNLQEIVVICRKKLHFWATVGGLQYIFFSTIPVQIYVKIKILDFEYELFQIKIKTSGHRN